MAHDVASVDGTAVSVVTIRIRSADGKDRLAVVGHGIPIGVDMPGIVGNARGTPGRSHRLAFPQHVGSGEEGLPGAIAAGIVVALTSRATVGQNRAELCIGVTVAVVAVGLVAGIGRPFVVIAPDVVPNPGCDGM